MEIVRAEIINPEVAVNKGHFDEAGVLEFSDHREFNYGGVYLNVHSRPDGNSAYLSAMDQPSDIFAPQEVKVWAKWEDEWGLVPSKGSERTFGVPVALKIKYLGHPKRDVYEPLFR